MPALLCAAEIAQRLAGLAGWQLKGRTIEKKFRFGGFREAIAFVDRVADLAEVADHHPDMLVHHREVTLVLWTHAAGGLTDRDFKLAADIERVD
ncbi:MAG: 4a-hydroxytetrahydrobiopterin dehydratase [Deltaproteobacteria bacterium]|nr:4a-hydroxytetrahydrobiopterin dehydratase [Deltaproteobacteria bacterium]